MDFFASKTAIQHFTDKLLMHVSSEIAALIPEQRHHSLSSLLHTHSEGKVTYNV